MLTDEEQQQIVQAMEEWARLVPEEPVLGFLGERLRTPRELVSDLVERTDWPFSRSWSSRCAARASGR